MQPTRNWDALREAITIACEKKGWSHRALAAKAGISTGAVTYLMTGRPAAGITVPSQIPRSVPRIEKALGWPQGTAYMLLAGEITAPPQMSPEVAQAELDQLEEIRQQFESDPRYMNLPPDRREYYTERFDSARERLQRLASRMLGEITSEIRDEIDDEMCPGE